MYSTPTEVNEIGNRMAERVKSTLEFASTGLEKCGSVKVFPMGETLFMYFLPIKVKFLSLQSLPLNRPVITSDPYMYLCIDCPKGISTLLLMYPQILEKGFQHFDVRKIYRHLGIALASEMSRWSTDQIKGEKCLHRFIHISRHFLFL